VASRAPTGLLAPAICGTRPGRSPPVQSPHSPEHRFGPAARPRSRGSRHTGQTVAGPDTTVAAKMHGLQPSFKSHQYRVTTRFFPGLHRGERMAPHPCRNIGKRVGPMATTPARASSVPRLIPGCRARHAKPLRQSLEPPIPAGRDMTRIGHWRTPGSTAICSRQNADGAPCTGTGPTNEQAETSCTP
jgi:hypothetical protein